MKTPTDAIVPPSTPLISQLFLDKYVFLVVSRFVRREVASAERGFICFDVVVCYVVCVPTGRSFVARHTDVALREPNARRLHDGNGRQRDASRHANDATADNAQSRNGEVVDSFCRAGGSSWRCWRDSAFGFRVEPLGSGSAAIAGFHKLYNRKGLNPDRDHWQPHPSPGCEVKGSHYTL